jgi:dolichol kinase
MRKAFHLASISIPLIVWIIPRPVGMIGVTVLAGVALGIDMARLRFRPVRYHFLRRTRAMLRAHERRSFAGATYMAVAYALAIMIFPRPVAVAAMLYNGLGDAMAALVGKRFGVHRTAWGKSWEGFGAALGTNLTIGLLLPGISIPGAIAGAIAAAGLEFAPLPLDDNLRVTLGGGAGAWVGMLLV